MSRIIGGIIADNEHVRLSFLAKDVVGVAVDGMGDGLELPSAASREKGHEFLPNCFVCSVRQGLSGRFPLATGGRQGWIRDMNIESLDDDATVKLCLGGHRLPFPLAMSKGEKKET